MAGAVVAAGGFIGTEDDYREVVRRVSAGRTNAVRRAVRRAEEVFRAIDEDRDGKIQAGEVERMLREIGTNPAMCQRELTIFMHEGGAGKEEEWWSDDDDDDDDDDEEKEEEEGGAQPRRRNDSEDRDDDRSSDDDYDTHRRRRERKEKIVEAKRRSRRKKKKKRRTRRRRREQQGQRLVTFPEVLHCFGFVFDSFGPEMGVEESFAKLRLRCTPPEVISAGGEVLALLNKVLDSGNGSSFPSSSSSSSFSRSTRLKGGMKKAREADLHGPACTMLRQVYGRGGLELLRAVGFRRQGHDGRKAMKEKENVAGGRDQRGSSSSLSSSSALKTGRKRGAVEMTVSLMMLPASVTIPMLHLRREEVEGNKRPDGSDIPSI